MDMRLSLGCDNLFRLIKFLMELLYNASWLFDTSLSSFQTIRETGHRFRETILALGGGRSPLEVCQINITSHITELINEQETCLMFFLCGQIFTNCRCCLWEIGLFFSLYFIRLHNHHLGPKNHSTGYLRLTGHPLILPASCFVLLISINSSVEQLHNS